MKIGLVLYCLNWVILIDDNKMSMKAIDWCSICLINVCVKDDVDDDEEDKDVLPVLDRATSILNMHGWWSHDPSNQIWLGAFDK